MSTPQSSPSVTFLQTLGCDDPQSILHLLRTNNAPTDPEQAVIRNIIQSGHTVLQNTHTGKQGQRLNQFIDSARAILHPIRLLPREIIADIVLHALNHHGGNPVPATMDTNEGPWPYSYICRLWRDVVISYPRLWSVWYIDTYGHSYLNAADRMRTIVDRSKDESIHVTLCTRYVSVSSRIISIILGESKRWKHVVIRCRSNALLDMLNSQIRGALNRLESLYIAVNVFGNEGETLESFTAFGLAPRLTNVTLDLTRTSRRTVDVSLPWSQLTHYREPFMGNSTTRTERVDILRRLLNVIHCELSPSYPRFDLYDGSPIALPHMRTFLASNSCVLQLLTLPALEILDLGIDSGYPCYIREFLQRSHCPLQELMLGITVRGQDLTDVLKLVPTLKSFVLRWSPFNGDLIAALTIKDDVAEPPILPILSRLSIHASDPAGPQDEQATPEEEAFMQMVESRRSDVVKADAQETCLRYVCCNFDCYGGFTEEFKKRAEKLRKGGLEIVLKNSRTE